MTNRVFYFRQVIEGTLELSHEEYSKVGFLASLCQRWEHSPDKPLNLDINTVSDAVEFANGQINQTTLLARAITRAINATKEVTDFLNIPLSPDDVELCNFPDAKIFPFIQGLNIKRSNVSSGSFVLSTYDNVEYGISMIRFGIRPAWDEIRIIVANRPDIAKPILKTLAEKHPKYLFTNKLTINMIKLLYDENVNLLNNPDIPYQNIITCLLMNEYLSSANSTQIIFELILYIKCDMTVLGNQLILLYKQPQTIRDSFYWIENLLSDREFNCDYSNETIDIILRRKFENPIKAHLLEICFRSTSKPPCTDPGKLHHALPLFELFGNNANGMISLLLERNWEYNYFDDINNKFLNNCINKCHYGVVSYLFSKIPQKTVINLDGSRHYCDLDEIFKLAGRYHLQLQLRFNDDSIRSLIKTNAISTFISNIRYGNTLVGKYTDPISDEIANVIISYGLHLDPKNKFYNVNFISKFHVEYYDRNLSAVVSTKNISYPFPSHYLRWSIRNKHIELAKMIIKMGGYMVLPNRYKYLELACKLNLTELIEAIITEEAKSK